MKIKIISAILAASFLFGAPTLSYSAPSRNTAPATTKQCRNHGKFVKCPLAATASSSSATSATAPTAPTAKTQCRDPKSGRFVKCPTSLAKSKQCRDAKGKFTKC